MRRPFYHTDAWINGAHAAAHDGGFSPFCADITNFLKIGENTIVVRCSAPLDASVPRGKQSATGKPYGCYYVPNTGIWQSVWIDFAGCDYISDYALFADYDSSAFYGEIVSAQGLADEAEITASFEGEEIARQTFKLFGKRNEYRVALPRISGRDYDWTPDFPRLIYVDFKLKKDGETVDVAHTRFVLLLLCRRTRLSDLVRNAERISILRQRNKIRDARVAGNRRGG